MKEMLIEKIKSKKSIIGIIGMGYVGLPLALVFSEAGHHVLGFDCDSEKQKTLLIDKKSYIKHIESSRIKKVIDSKNMDVTTNLSRVREVDTIIICLPTPLNAYKEPDLSYITDTLDEICPFLKKGQLVALESTTYPGTTEEVIKPYLESRDFNVGTDVFLVYSPEREDPGNENFTTADIPKIVGGVTKDCLEVGIALYESVISKIVPVSSTQTAEMAKLLENIYRAVNIGLVNEMKVLADKMSVDIWEVIDAASTKPFGFVPFYPGPGWGGHCIPIDPFYLTWKAKAYDVSTRFIELSGEINTMMPEWVVQKITDALNALKLPVNGSRIMVVGLAYKKNIDDTRESPSIKIMEILRAKGAIVSYSDPFIPRFPKMREHVFELDSVDLSQVTIENVDCIVIGANHDVINYDLIKKYGKLIVDTRGVYREESHKIIKA